MSDFIYKWLPGEPGKPTIVALHGTGGTESDLISLTQFVALGASILSPRGRVLEGPMPRWFRRFGEGQFDLEDVERRALELADFLVEAAQQYEFDASNVWALGYSNGANIATATLLLRPETLRGVIALRGQTVLKSRADLSGKAVLMLNGESDPIVPGEDARSYADFLRACGADVTQHFARADHSLTRDELETARKWLQDR